MLFAIGFVLTLHAAIRIFNLFHDAHWDSLIGTDDEIDAILARIPKRISPHV